MEKKIAKIGIIMVLALALILSSLGALNLGDTFAKEFDVGAKDQITAQAAETWTYPASAPTASFGGAGTVGSPYEISTAQQLADLSYFVNNKNEAFNTAHYKLTADIVLNDGVINENSTLANAWTAIGTNTNPFLGTFDGDGHTVSGIYISVTTNCQGLFGVIGPERSGAGATVENVGVKNSYISGNSFVGGVVGSSNFSTVSNCYNRGKVIGSETTGGVVGYNNSGTVINCYNHGAVTGTNNVGGVVGNIAGGSSAEASVANCYNQGAVTGTKNVGGVAGNIYSDSKLTNCYNSGAVSGTTNVGGVLGFITGGTVTNSYYLKTDTINNTINLVIGGYYDSQFVAKNCSTFGTNKQLTTEGIIVKDDRNNVLVTFAAGADLKNTLNTGAGAYGSAAAAWVDVAGGYAKFDDATYQWYTKDPNATEFFIEKASDLMGLSNLVNGTYTGVAGQSNVAIPFTNKTIKLTSNIVLNDGTIDKNSTSANSWTPIGTATNNFKGTFDGDSYTVSGIYINSTAEDQGLFGVIFQPGIVKNVGVVNSYIKGKSYVGAVVGSNSYGVVINCYNTGAVTASGDPAETSVAKSVAVGGIVGYNSGTVANCYNEGTVTSTATADDRTYVGGVVGTNGKYTQNCYNIGAVTATITSPTCYVGGVVGNHTGSASGLYFLQKGSINAGLEAVGVKSEHAIPSNCSTFVGTDGNLSVPTNIGSNKYTTLIAALNGGADSYNRNPEQGVRALPWFIVKDGYPNLIPSVTIDTTKFNIYANGLAITLKAATGNPNLTNIYDNSGNLVNLLKFDDGAPQGKAENKDLSQYTIYGGGRDNAPIGIGVVAVYGDTSITIEGGKVKNIYGGGAGNLYAIVTGKKIVNLSGAPTIGSASPSAGIVINGGTTTKNGVDSFIINGALTGAAKSINLVLPSGYEEKIVATKATNPAADLTADDVAKFAIVGGGSTTKKFEVKTTEKTNLYVVNDIISLTKPTFKDPSKTSVVYNGANQSAELRNLLTGFDETTMEIAIAPVTATDVGAYTITVSLKDITKYQWVDVTNTPITFPTNITQAPNSISAITISNWTYGGTPSVPTAWANFGSETAIFSYSATENGSYTPALPSANAGNYWVKATIRETTNYQGAEFKWQFAITKANLTVTASSHSVTYGDPTPAYTVAYSGFVNGENESVLTKQPTASSLYATTTPVGSIATTASGGEDENYEFNYFAGSVTIGQATPTISGIPTAELNKEYGTPLSGISLSGGTASTAGTFTWATGTTIPSVGNTEYEVTFTPTDNTNYKTVTCKVTPTIEKKPLTITAKPHAITYGDAPNNNGVTYNGFITGENASNLTGTLQYSYTYTQYGDVGSYKITPSGLTSANYAISFVDGNLTVNQLNITATITPNGKVYDGTTTATINKTDFSQVVNNDVLSLAGGTLTFSDKVAGTSKTVTAVGYTLAGDKNANYKLGSVTANSADITKKALTVTGANVIIEKNYDGTTDVKTPLKKDKNYTITGFVDGESGDITVTAATYADKNVGEDKVITVTYALDTTTAVNYSTATSEMTLKGKIVSLSATEGTDYTVTSVGGEPVTVGGVKYFKDNYKITLIEGGKYNKISADEATLASGGKEIEVSGEGSTFTFYVTNDKGEIGQIIIQYGIDRTLPTIDATWTIKDSENTEVAPNSWFNGDKVTVSIGNIRDAGSGIDWTDDGAANTRMTLKKGENAVAFVKNTALNTVSFDLNSKDGPINGVYVLTVYDYVGNSVSKTITIDKHDNVAPTIDLSAIDFTKWQGATTITPVVADTVVEGIASGIVEIKINGVVQNSVTFGANGRHDFVVEVKDDAGNVTKIDKMLLCDINIDLFNAKFSGNTPKDTQNASDARAIFNKLSNEAKLHISGNVASNIVASANYAGLLKYEEEQKEAIKTIQIAALKTAIDDAVATMTKDAVTSMKAANISVDVFVGVGKEYQDKYNNVLTAMSVVNKLNSTVDNNSQLVGWVDTYDKLDEKVKTFVDVIIKADVVTTNKNNLAVVNAIKDKVDAIKMPVTSQNIEAAKTVVGEYDKLGNEIKKLVSVSTTEKLENLKKIIGKTNETQTIIDAIPDVVPSPLTDAYVDSVMKAKTAVDNLDNNVKSLVKTEKVDKGLAEIAKDETIKKNNDLASEIAKAIMKSNDSMIADKILECWKTYDSADTAIKALVNKMLPASFATLETNAETAKTNVEAIKAIDLTKITSDNATRTEAEKVVAAINSLNTQTQKIVKNECGELLNEMIKLINAYEAITTLPSTDNKVDDCELCNGSVSGGVNHSTAEHLKKIENAKKAFEKLNDKEKEKLGKELCDKINAQYNAMLNYVEQLNQSLKVKDNDKDISVYGIVTGVDQSNIPDVETAEEIFIKVNVEKTDSKIDEFTKTKIVSYDISLLGKTASATEFTKLQPKEHETVTVRMPIGSNFLVDTLEIYHVLNDGRRERIVNFTLSEINGQLYAIFDVSSFSEFFAYGETKNSTTDSDGGSGGTISGGDIFDKSIENEIKFKDTNSIVADVSNRENTLSKSILDAINEAESGKVVKVIFKEGEISITKEKLKGVALDKKSYTYAELKALIEVPEITPTPTPTPTEKPTEPTEPTEKKCWLCGACPMFLGLCLWIWLAIAIVVVTVVVIIVVKKKKKDDEENAEDVKNKKK